MPPLSNLKHEAFARAVAGGSSLADAYKANVAEPGSKQIAFYANSARLASRYSNRIVELREKIIAAAEAKLILTKAGAAEFYSSVARANPAKLEGQEHLAQEAVSWVDAEGNTRTRFKLPPKADCLAALAKLMGWNEAEKHDHAHLHTLVDTPALQMLRVARQNPASHLPGAATGTAEGGNGHLAQVWTSPDELFEAELGPVETLQDG